jgi:hypothetical protein
MGKIELIEREIERLDEGSFAALRAWFIEYDNARWDRQIESDATAGKLDSLIEEALAEHRDGKTKAL